MKPSVVAHSDWGASASSRWCARAALCAGGAYRASAPEPVGDLRTFVRRAAQAGSTLLGFDFPIGLPAWYAAAIGVTSFVDFLRELASGGRAGFYEVAASPDEISLERPFYPARPGGATHRHLLDALGAAAMRDLLRQCDRGYDGRRSAAPMFWTLGGQQVGKAAISGWRDVLGPTLAEAPDDVAIWPFDGTLDELLGRQRVVVVETYPTELYAHLGVSFAGGESKRRRADRQRNAGALVAWAEAAGVLLSDDLRAAIADGFGDGPNGDDRFDAVVGLFGMLNVVLGRRDPGEPDDGAARSVEGWMLGQAAARPLARDKLVRRLAEVSHATWRRQAHRDKGIPLEELGAEVTDHDLERAEDAVRELERLGVVRLPR